MPNESDTVEAAHGVGNLAFYRMCRDFPAHDQWEVVYDKVLFIARVYSVGRNMGGQWEAIAQAIVQIGAKLDKHLAELDGTLFPDNSKRVVKVHAMLDEAVCKALQTKGIDAKGRPSFASKYLHFHRPDAFPILDSLAKAGLASKTGDFKTKRCKPKDYPVFCERLAEYMKRPKIVGRSLRHIDTKLVTLGRHINELNGIKKEAKRAASNKRRA